MWSTILLPALPQFSNQAPPGAQQLTRPDFSNLPHLGHFILRTIGDVNAGMLLLIGVRTFSSRSTGVVADVPGVVADVPGVVADVPGVVADVHTVPDIDPGEPVNISIFFAFESTQAAPQSFCLNAAAS